MGVRTRKRMVCAVAMLATSGGVSLGQSEGRRSGQSGVPSTAPLTVVRAGPLIDGVSEAPRKNQLIFVRGDRIEKVADRYAAVSGVGNRSAAATGSRGGQDQGVQDSAVVGGQAGKPGFAAVVDGGRVEGDRRRDARLAEESGVPRLQRDRFAAGAGRRM